MASSNAFVSFMLSNITQFISIKLDQNTYLLWFSQFVPMLHAYDLLVIVDGYDPCPLSEVVFDATSKSNIEFLT